MLEVDLRELKKCSSCGICEFLCPTYNAKKNESWGARGRLLIVRSLIKGNPAADRGVVDRIYSCTMCKVCEFICPSRVKVTEIIGKVREQLRRANLGPLASQSKIADNIIKNWSIFGNYSTLKKLKRKAIYLYVGCMFKHKYSEILELAQQILEQARVEYSLIDKERCCGAYLAFLGYAGDLSRYVEKHAMLIKEYRPELLVALCPSCFTTLKTYYSKILNASVIHITQLLSKLLEEKRLEPKRPFDHRVAYHDPCHLGRYEKVYTEPRRVLSAIPNLELLELARNREESACCGGTIRVPFGNLRWQLSSAIINDARSTNAEYLATSCLTCFYNLSLAGNCEKIVTIYDLLAYSLELLSEIPVAKEPKYF